MRPLLATWLGRCDYASAFSVQRALVERVAAGGPEVLLLLEHDPVYTLGRRAGDGEVLLDARELQRQGITVERTDRGGRVTYHGPGQLVGYPIMDLGPAGDLVGYVRKLERAMIALAASYGLRAGVEPGLTGVWVGREKIGAIGVHVSRGITTHGFAFNVDPDLSAFNGIIPCGIVDRGVTSLAQLGAIPPPVKDVAVRAAGLVARELQRPAALVHPIHAGIRDGDLRSDLAGAVRRGEA